jgi:hypothetical protein
MQGVLDWTADNWLTLATFAVATIVAVYLYHRQKQPKTLDYAATSQLIGTGGSAHSRLQVRWEDILPWEHSQNLNAKRSHILESPRIVKIHIRNTGKRAIDESDFKEPITVEVESGWIVDLAVTVSSRKNMFSLEADRNAIYSEKKWTLTPRLLNSGDWIDLRIITEKSPDLPKVTSWIQGPVSRNETQA